MITSGTAFPCKPKYSVPLLHQAGDEYSTSSFPIPHHDTSLPTDLPHFSRFRVILLYTPQTSLHLLIPLMPRKAIPILPYIPPVLPESHSISGHSRDVAVRRPTATPECIVLTWSTDRPTRQPP
jgi:hypothetical protein